jgi:hypothetical protein
LEMGKSPSGLVESASDLRSIDMIVIRITN